MPGKVVKGLVNGVARSSRQSIAVNSFAITPAMDIITISLTAISLANWNPERSGHKPGLKDKLGRKSGQKSKL